MEQTIPIHGAINLSDHGIVGEEGEYVLLPIETQDGEMQNALVTAEAAQTILQQQLLQQKAVIIVNAEVNNDTIHPEIKREVPNEPQSSVQTVVGQPQGNMTTVITAFICPVCGMTFQRRAALMSHGKIHPEFQNHKCTICGKTFTRLDFVKRHVRSHLGYPHECQECHRSYKEPEELNAHHIKLHTKQRKIHSCDICGKVLKNAFNLKEHSRVHTGEKPYLCDTCPVRFARSVDLRNHQFVHNEDLRYFCHICGKRFRRPEGRRIHLRNHMGVKPYKCDICDKGFAGRSGYNIHYRNHHSTVSSTMVSKQVIAPPEAKFIAPNSESIINTATLDSENIHIPPEPATVIHLAPGQSLQSVLQQALQ